MRQGRLAVLASVIAVVAACGGTSPSTSSTSTSATAVGPGAVASTPAVTTTAAAGTPWAPAAAATAQPSPSASPVDATGPAASASPSPSSSALARLATTYGRLSTVANPEIRSCVNHAANVTTLAQAKAAARLCHDRVAGSIAAFHDTDWGPLTAQAATLDAAIARVDGLLVQMQRAPTLKAFLAAYDQLGPALTTLRSDANRLRAALGLPPVPASAFT